MKQILYVYLSLFYLHTTIANITKIPAGRLRDDTKPGRLVNASIPIQNKHLLVTNPNFRLSTFDPLIPPSEKTWSRFLPRAFSYLQDTTQLVCSAGGPECGANQFCYNGLGCCQNTQFGCGDQTCCDIGSTCCGTSCCPMGYSCTTVNGQTGCCLTGSTCQAQGDVVDTVEGLADITKGEQCRDPGYGLCPSGNFCCKAGKHCLRDLLGNYSCERSCQDADFKICPTNNFCCPPEASCYIGSDGSQQCAVFITSTFSSLTTTPPFANLSNTTTSFIFSTSTVVVNISYPTQDPYTTTLVLAPSTIEIPIPTTVVVSAVIPTNLSMGLTPIETTTSGNVRSLFPTTYTTSSTSSSTSPMTASTPPLHNGGLDDVFTNQGPRPYSRRIGLAGAMVAALYQVFV